MANPLILVTGAAGKNRPHLLSSNFWSAAILCAPSSVNQMRGRNDWPL